MFFGRKEEEKLYAECGQDERTSINIFIKVTVYLPFYGNLLPVSVLDPKVPVLRRNKATNSSSSTDPFSAATKPFVLGNLFKLERFAITFARTV